MELILSLAWLAIVAWLILRAFNQRGLFKTLSRHAAPAPDSAPRVTVIVPARDEASNIAACLHGLMRQDYPASRLQVIVVDDHSSDATAAIAAQFCGGAIPLTVLESPSLPPRWTGKSHACWTGAQAAPDAEWLCFIDADVRVAPALLSSAVAAANADRLDLLSLAPRQELKTFAERLVIPCGLLILSVCQDLRTVQSRDSAAVTATGQFMLVRNDAYHDAGGHAAVATVICEDIALAGELKRHGAAVMLQSGADLVSVRMYDGWRTLWPGFAKNLVDMFGGVVPTASIALAAVVLAWAAWLVPVLNAWSCVHEGTTTACTALPVALAGSASIIGLHLAAAGYFSIPPWYGLLFPLGYSAGALIAADSIRRRLRRQVSWKGRTYP